LVDIHFESRPVDNGVDFGVTVFSNLHTETYLNVDKEGEDIAYTSTHSMLDLGNDEEHMAMKIIEYIKLLLHVEIWLSYYQSSLCAIEVVSLSEKVIATVGRYKLGKTYDKQADYSVKAFSNKINPRYPSKDDEKLFWEFSNEYDDFRFYKGGRILTSSQAKPLYSDLYKQFVDTESWQAVGKDLDEDENKFLIKQWEFWLLLITLGAVYITYVNSSFVIGIVKDHPVPFAILFLPLIASFITGFILLYKENLRKNNPKHLYLMIDQRVITFTNSLGRYLMYVAVPMSILIAGLAFAPQLYDGANYLSLYDFGQKYIWPLLLFPIIAVLILFSLFKTTRSSLYALLLSIAASMLFIATAIAYTPENDYVSVWYEAPTAFILLTTPVLYLFHYIYQKYKKD
jgi:uncharacterized membrane protein